MSYSSIKVNEHRKRTAQFVRETKSSKRCSDCKKKFPFYVMQFDHVRGKKSFNLSSVTRNNISLERIKKEIEKCDIVCANCHAIRTFLRKAAGNGA